MRSPSSRLLVLLLGAVLADCGGGSPAVPTPSLPAFERLAIAQQVVSTALGGLTPGTFAARSVDTGTVRFVNGELAGEQSARVTGAVQHESSESSGNCVVDLRVTFTPDQGAAAQGTACGEPVNVAF